MAHVETRGTFTVMSDAMRDIREAEEVLRAEQHEAWRRYVERVNAILAYDLQLEDEPGDSDDVPDLAHLLAAVRARVDELRLQTHLGAMEGEELVGRMRAAFHRMARGPAGQVSA